MTRRDAFLAAARFRVLVLLGAAVVAPGADATICKYIDADGNIVDSNVAQGKGARKLSCEIADAAPRSKATAPGGSASVGTPAHFPRVEPATQRNRDELRRRVLNDELASEEKLLGEARVAYGNGAPQPLADEQNDAERYRQRIAKLRQAVQLHERNVEALRKELAAIR